MENHLVRVEFSFEGTDLDPLFELEDQLEEAIQKAGVGELDGDEVGQGVAVIFMYGPDADALLHAILPVLRASELVRDGFVLKQYGPPEDGVVEERVELSELLNLQ